MIRSQKSTRKQPKRARATSSSGKGSPFPRRGRPTKSSQREILEAGNGWPIVREFRFRPLRTPVDVQFAPYYERVLKGDISAIGNYVDYVDSQNAALCAVPVAERLKLRADQRVQRKLDSSFYELIGRLVTIRFYAAADSVLSDIERRGVLSWPSNRSTYDCWYTLLLPLCQHARQFIREARASCPDANRDKLWRDYVLQPVAPTHYKHFIGEPDEDNLNLQREANELDKERRRRAIEGLLVRAKSHTKDSVRSRLSTLGIRGKGLERLVEGNFHLKSVQEFSLFGFVSREVFDDLAKTRPVLSTPAAVARRYACKIARVSESWASRKNVRK